MQHSDVFIGDHSYPVDRCVHAYNAGLMEYKHMRYRGITLPC